MVAPEPGVRPRRRAAQSLFLDDRHVLEQVCLGAFVFAPLVGTTSFRTNHNRHLFHVRASYEAELRKIVGHLATLGINNIAVVTALEKNIPTIAGGYLGGQVPKDAAVIRLDFAAHLKARESTLKKYEDTFGAEARRYFGIDQSVIDRSALSYLNVINPMLTMDVSESSILQSIRKLGWTRPRDTGKQSSNCRLNDLGIFIHHQQYGFNPYTAEIAEQVRFGLMSRSEGIRRAFSIPKPSQVSTQAKQVGVDLNA